MKKHLLALLILSVLTGTTSLYAGRIPVIFDTDLGNDVDDAIALSMLYSYADEGKGVDAWIDRTITIDSIECSNLKFEVNATGESTVSYLNVENEFTLISSGHGKFVSDNVNVGGELIMDDIVGSTLSCKGRTSTLTINNSGDGLCEFIGAYKTKEIYQSEKAQVVVREF